MAPASRVPDRALYYRVRGWEVRSFPREDLVFASAVIAAVRLYAVDDEQPDGLLHATADLRRTYPHVRLVPQEPLAVTGTVVLYAYRDGCPHAHPLWPRDGGGEAR